MGNRKGLLYVSVMLTLLASGVGTFSAQAADITNPEQTISDTKTGNAFGGKADTSGDNAVGNKLTIKYPGTVVGNTYGGYAENGAATKNTMILNGGIAGDLDYYNYGDVYGGYINSKSSTASATGNVVTTYGSIATGNVIGGDTEGTGEASNNEVILENTQVVMNVYGGYSYNGSAKNNKVTIKGSNNSKVYLGTVYGGLANKSGDSINNSVTLSGSTIVGNGAARYGIFVSGGYSRYGSVTDNKLNIKDESYIWSNIAGGLIDLDTTKQAKGDVSNNTITMTGGTVELAAFGGLNQGLGDAKENSINISGGTVDIDVSGGAAFTGSVKQNTVTISGTAKVTRNVYGGSSLTEAGAGTATENQVNIEGGSIGKNIYGGETKGTGDASENVVTISGGTVNADVYGGYAAAGNATGNSVNLKGGTFAATTLYGGWVNDTGTGQSTDNTLNVYAKGLTVANIDDFQNVNFLVPADMTTDDTMLTVMGTAKLKGANIRAGLQSDKVLGDTPKTITLLYANTLNVDDTTSYGLLNSAEVITPAYLVASAQVRQLDDNTIVMDLPAWQEVPQDDPKPQPNDGLNDNSDTKDDPEPQPDTNQSDNSDAHDDTTPEPTPWHISPDTKLFAEARATAMHTLTTAADFAATNGYDGAISAYAAEHGIRGQFTPYLVLGGHDLRADTGSHVDSQGLNANLGLVRRLYGKNHTDTILPFIEYGNGNYTSHLDDGARGDGDQRYIGGGVIVRRDQSDGLHYEGMVRAGRLQGDFKGRIAGYQTSYDSSAPYVSAMAGIGKIVPAGQNASYDFYGKFFWDHLSSDSVVVHNSLGTAGYYFDSINSYRTRLGLRWTKHQSETKSYYAGLAWDCEFGGDAHAKYRNFNTPSPSTQGSSAMLEIGWESQATKDNPWGADLHLTGWAGTQRGVTYSVSVTRAF